MVGIGAQRLPERLAEKVGCVILAGFGGALDPSLCVGDVVLDWPVEDLKGPAPAGPFRLGRIYCASGIVATAEQKSILFAQTGASAVEMEARAAAPVGVERGTSAAEAAASGVAAAPAAESAASAAAPASAAAEA